ncbi:hypothetical protein Celaphus_00014827, partial [Cervus elaphus hippelaphus]
METLSEIPRWLPKENPKFSSKNYNFEKRFLLESVAVPALALPAQHEQSTGMLKTTALLDEDS